MRRDRVASIPDLERRVEALERTMWGEVLPEDEKPNKATQPTVFTAAEGLDLIEDEMVATLDGRDLGLTLTEYELLHYLARHPRKAFTPQQILAHVWENAMMVTDRTVHAHVKNLKEKLGRLGGVIETVRGVGYRCNPDAVRGGEMPAEALASRADALAKDIGARGSGEHPSIDEELFEEAAGLLRELRDAILSMDEWRG